MTGLSRRQDDLSDFSPGHFEGRLKQRFGNDFDTSAYYLYGETPVVQTGPMTSYTISVKTSNVSNAGTDGKVSLALTGDLGTTPDLQLDKKTKKTKGNPFEKGKVDSFLISNTPSAGNLTSAKVNLQESGLAPAWHLDSITVRDETTGNTYLFNCKDWLDKKQGLTRDLPLVTDQPTNTNFTISVQTGNVKGAGTDANVYATLVGDYGESQEFHLHKSVKGGNKFEDGQIDDFKFEQQPYIGELRELRIRHDNKGLFGSAWFLESIKVHDSLPDANYYFQCGEWLDKKHGLKRTLFPGTVFKPNRM